jgi:circadian clock protein KaiB
MRKPSAKGDRDAPENREITRFRLYTADETPNSLRAIANLQAICQEYYPNRWQIEMVDILREPLRVLSEKILVTPTLVRLSPAPVRTIVGDLNSKKEVLRALGLEERVE